MPAEDFVLARGLRDTRGALARWNNRPWPVVGSWVIGALAVAALLLSAVWIVAVIARPDPTPIYIPALHGTPDAGHVGFVLWRNSLVLALHAVACVAGFIAGSSLPLSAARRSGFSRWIHEKARPVALGWVVLVTAFSLSTQAYVLGSEGATIANELQISTGALILTVLPHALPELTALFLPLAAWTIASRRDQWHDLLAATFATTALAIPVLVATASWEIYVWPELIELASPLY